MKRSSWLLVVLAPAAVRSKWVKEELNSALARQLAENRIYVLPILYRDCEIPAFLLDKAYADFRRNYQSGFQQLLSTLQRRYFIELGERQIPLSDIAISAERFIKPSITSAVSRKLYFLDLNKTWDKSLALLEGVWRGSSGRMQLSIDGDQIVGKYDWQGIPLSGRISWRTEKRRCGV